MGRITVYQGASICPQGRRVAASLSLSPGCSTWTRQRLAASLSLSPGCSGTRQPDLVPTGRHIHQRSPSNASAALHPEPSTCPQQEVPRGCDGEGHGVYRATVCCQDLTGSWKRTSQSVRYPLELPVRSQLVAEEEGGRGSMATWSKRPSEAGQVAVSWRFWKGHACSSAWSCSRVPMRTSC